MSIELKFRIHTNHLEAEFTGTRDTDDELGESIRLWSEIPTQCEKYGLNKIIAISRLNRRLKLDNTFVFADKFEAIGWKPNYKMAGVVFDEKLLLDYELLATFINNFGYECRIFHTIKDAKKWLLDS